MTKALLALAVACAPVTPAAAQVAANTLPTGGSVAAGAAAISQNAGNMQVQQSTSSAIINWQSFSIGSGARVSFTQPSASAVALNRVVGTDPSQILGQLTANGRVFLTNPAGVLFARGASIDVGSLMATTLSISNQDFLAGRYTFTNSGAAGQVVNQGTIRVSGYAALAGAQIRNEGVISARLGTIALAAGDGVSLDMVGDSLMNIRIDAAALNASIVHTGTLEADGGRIMIHSSGVNTLLDGVINTTGIIRADSIGSANGQITLTSGGSGAVSGGAITLTGNGSLTSTGGSITVAGGAVTVGGTSNVTANGGVITLNGISVALTSEDKVAAPAGTIVVKADTVTVAERSVVAIAGAQVTNRREEARTGAAAGATVVQLPRLLPAETSPVGRTTQVMDQAVRAPVGRLPRMAFRIQGLGVSLPSP